MLVPTVFSVERHQLLTSEPPLLSFLKNRFPKHAPYLFIYRHRLHESFGVAGWIPQKQGRLRFVDLLPLGPSLTMDRDDVRLLDRLLNPKPTDVMTAKDHARMERAHERAENRTSQDEAEEMVDVKRHIMKKYVRDPGPFYADAKRATPIKQPLSAGRR